jgi:hypothetical protein
MAKRRFYLIFVLLLIFLIFSSCSVGRHDRYDLRGQNKRYFAAQVDATTPEQHVEELEQVKLLESRKLLIIRRLIFNALFNLDHEGNWQDQALGEITELGLGKYPKKVVIKKLKYHLNFPQIADQAVILAAKLNYPGYESAFKRYLIKYGDGRMARAFAHSPSLNLRKAGKDKLAKQIKRYHGRYREPQRMVVYKLSEATIDDMYIASNKNRLHITKEKLDSLIWNAAILVNKHGGWIKPERATKLYYILKHLDSYQVVNSLIRHVHHPVFRSQVLVVGIKLGFPGTEERLNQILMRSGNKTMAENYLNSGSRILREGGERWAAPMVIVSDRTQVATKQPGENSKYI